MPIVTAIGRLLSRLAQFFGLERFDAQFQQGMLARQLDEPVRQLGERLVRLIRGGGGEDVSP
jgi:hypothetical protein